MPLVLEFPRVYADANVIMHFALIFLGMELSIVFF